MATREEYAKRSREERLARIAETPGELALAVKGRSDEVLSRRPDGKNWAAKEVICHLRDNEEWFLIRLQQIMLMDEPRFVTTNPDRWAEERQYLRPGYPFNRSNPGQALSTGGLPEGAPGSAGARVPAVARAALRGAAGGRSGPGSAPDRATPVKWITLTRLMIKETPQRRRVRGRRRGTSPRPTAKIRSAPMPPAGRRYFAEGGGPGQYA